MMKKNISQLLEKFKTGLAEGKDPYFDSEEILNSNFGLGTKTVSF